MIKICIITGSHLTNNPRVVKEANTLTDAGYSVTIVTVWSQIRKEIDDLKLLRRRVSYIGIRNNSINTFDELWSKTFRKVAEYLNVHTPWESIYSVNAGLSQLIKRSKKITSDLYICHQEVGLIAGIALLDQGRKVAFDLEDWYSEDLLPEARKKMPIGKLKRLEEKALTHGSYVTTTSHAMAQAMAETYGAPKPQVLYNVFPPAKKTPGHFPNDRIRLCWFSQTIGPGRGLETLMQAVNNIKSDRWELHLIGNTSLNYLNHLIEILHPDIRNQVVHHPFLQHDALESTLAGMDVGLALEEPNCKSRMYTVTNKLFQYLQAGVGIIATDTLGQREIYQTVPNAIQLIKHQDSKALCQALEIWLNNPSILKQAQKDALEAYKLHFNWEIESVKLLALVNQALQGTIH